MIHKITKLMTKMEESKYSPDTIKKNLNIYKERLEPYDYVSLARHERRPKPLDFIENLIEDPLFLKGDRYYGDDKAIVGGVGYFEGIPVTFIGTNKGRNVEENIHNNFGMASPEGYRKSLRLMKQAEKFDRPIINFVDTAGAYPGVGAEERGQGESIARNLFEMNALTVPIISIITGEGGSGGALALSLANYNIMMEFSVYSILSPEGFATILWKDSSKYKEATEIMKLTSKDLKKMGIIEEIIEEDLPIGLKYYDDNFERLKRSISKALKKHQRFSKNNIVKLRQEKFRRMDGIWG